MDHGTFNALDELKVAIVMAKMVCSIGLLSTFFWGEEVRVDVNGDVKFL